MTLSEPSNEYMTALLSGSREESKAPEMILSVLEGLPGQLWSHDVSELIVLS